MMNKDKFIPQGRLAEVRHAAPLGWKTVSMMAEDNGTSPSYIMVPLKVARTLVALEPVFKKMSPEERNILASGEYSDQKAVAKKYGKNGIKAHRLLTKIFELLAFLVLLAVPLCRAQTISPVVVEGTAKKFSGSFTIRNDGLTPLAAIVEAPRSFDGCDGVPCQVRNLDESVKLTLSETSARIGPRSSWTFSYRLRCPERCAVMLTVTLTGLKAQNGLAIRVQLPHVVYACKTKKDCRKKILAGPPLGWIRFQSDDPKNSACVVVPLTPKMAAALAALEPRAIQVWP